MRLILCAAALLLLLPLTADAQAKGKAKAPAPQKVTGGDAAAAAGLTLGGFAISGILCVLASLLAYVGFVSIPILVAGYRGHPDLMAIGAVVILFGWTFLGWGIALVWALTAIRRPVEQGLSVTVHAPVAPPPVARPAEVRYEAGRGPFDFG